MWVFGDGNVCVCVFETVLSLQKRKKNRIKKFHCSTACDVLAEVLLTGSKDAFAFGIMYVQSGGK